MKTSPSVSFGLYATAIKQDSSFACTDLQTFAKIIDLKTNNVTNKPYATYEPDYWLLDGNFKFFPTNTSAIHVGLMSLSQSDENGDFLVYPELTITFGSAHSTEGLTFKFDQFAEEYCSSMLVDYYDSGDALIGSFNHYPASWEYQTTETVSDFKKIVVTFYATSKPYRYLRLRSIDFGQLIYFTGAEIKRASVVEQVNPIAIELPFNTLDLTLQTNTFSIINPSGEYAALQNRQPLDVYEMVDGDSVYMGLYYLDTWENPSDTQIVFRANDAIGVMDTQRYMGGIWTSPVNSETLIQSIMDEINIPYDLDPDLYGISIKGWIPVCTYREALQQIAFAIGAYINCARSSIVGIYKTTLASSLTEFDYTITRADKGVDQSLTLKPLVTGVEITSHDYVSITDVSTLYNGSLAAGTYTILFDSPKHDLSVSGATVSSSGANYAILTVASPGTITLTGQGYTDTARIFSEYTAGLDPSVKPNIVQIKDATLINSSNGATATARVYDYYQQRYLQKMKLYASKAGAGNSAAVDTLYNSQVGTVIEKASIDLTGGFVIKAEAVGVIQ